MDIALALASAVAGIAAALRVGYVLGRQDREAARQYPYRWSCTVCGEFKASSNDAEIVERVRRNHLERCHA